MGRMTLLGTGGALVVAAQTPIFVAAGTGDYTDVGLGKLTLEPTYPAGILAGDYIACLAVGYLDDVTAPAGWSSGYKAAAFSNQQSTWFFKDDRATGSESGVVTFPTLGSDRTAAQIYAFRYVKVVSPGLDAIEDADETNGTGAISNPSVTPLGTLRLGVIGCIGFTTGTITPTGTPSGGTWAEVAEYKAPSVFFCELQTVDLSAGGAISGGTTTLTGSNQGVCIAFALPGH